MVQTNTMGLLALGINTGGECLRSEAENQVQHLAVLAKSNSNKNLPKMFFIFPISASLCATVWCFQ